MFTPHRFPASAWGQYSKNGYSLTLFTPGLNQAKNMDAEGFLSAIRDIYTSFDNIDDDSPCVFVKICNQKTDSVYLRMDRDHSEIYKKDRSGKVTTLASWQAASVFRGFSQQELWCNMVSLAKKKVA